MALTLELASPAFNHTRTMPEAKNLIVRLRPVNYFTAMFNLTRQQQMFLCSVLLLLLVGWTVRAWRIAHPPERSPMTAVR